MWPTDARTRSVGRATLAALLLAALALAPGCGGETEDADPETWQRGINLTAFDPTALELPAADAALFEIARADASHVAIVPTWYMRDAGSSAVRRLASRTPRDAGIENAAEIAHSLGLEVTLKPHVDVLDGTFRGAVSPRSPARWFASYGRMLVHYAELAEEIGATMLVVGTELESLSQHEQRFRDLIAAARERYSGSLTYGANWIDEAERVGFWDALDFIGIDAYMPLRTKAADPSVEALEAAWIPYRIRIERLQERTDIPVLFTELGYQSRVGAARRPFDGPHATGAPSEQAQNRAYVAAFRTWSETDWFRGIYWWDWPATRESPEVAERSYSPRDKLAEATLRRWHRLLRGRGGAAAG